MKPRKIIAETDAQIDLTPMLDVVFIMLIFFIVTATFIKESTLAFSRPDKNQQVASKNITDHIVVVIHPDNQLTIGDIYIDKRALRAHFEQHQAKNPDAQVIIKAHNQSKTSALTAVADAANSADMNVSLENIKEP